MNFSAAVAFLLAAGFFFFVSALVTTVTPAATAAMVLEAKKNFSFAAGDIVAKIISAVAIAAKHLDKELRPCGQLSGSAPILFSGAAWVLEPSSSNKNNNTDDRGSSDESVPLLSSLGVATATEPMGYGPDISSLADDGSDDDDNDENNDDRAADPAPPAEADTAAASAIALPEVSMTAEQAAALAWEEWAVLDESYLFDLAEVSRRQDRASGTCVAARCDWDLLAQPDVFYKTSGPVLVLTTPEGGVFYPQQIKRYEGEVSWADLDDDDEDW